MLVIEDTYLWQINYLYFGNQGNLTYYPSIDQTDGIDRWNEQMKLIPMELSINLINPILLLTLIAFFLITLIKHK